MRSPTTGSSGAIRSTTGTGWRLSLIHISLGVTLYIPTEFCSYRGEALDKKTPLLKSREAINEQSLRILRRFVNSTAKRVVLCAGVEQEYFLIDKAKYLQRKDLIYTCLLYTSSGRPMKPKLL